MGGLQTFRLEALNGRIAPITAAPKGLACTLEADIPIGALVDRNGWILRLSASRSIGQDADVGLTVRSDRAPEWPVWSAQRQQADLHSWDSPTAAIDR